MKALVYEGPRELNVREVPVPEASERDVVIRVERVGICGSEMSGYLGHNSLRKPPLVMGHEFAGIVDRVGELVTMHKPGDRVTVNPLISCGRCADCLDGKANLCEHRYLIGAGSPGAFAEYTVAPEVNVLSLPSHLSADLGALAEPLACAVHVCRQAAMQPHERLLIAGAGPIGLFVLQAAKRFGLEQIVVLDTNTKRLAIAAKLGGIPVDSADELASRKPPRGFHAAVDAVGIDATRTQCMHMVRPGGKVLFSGLHAAESQLPVNLAVRNEIAMFGSFGYLPSDFEIALSWLSEGKIDLMPWVKHAPLEQGKECFEMLLSDPGSTAKVILTLD